MYFDYSLLFTNKIAENVQFISLPLEVTGLLLTLIEIQKPMLADKIESYLDNIETRTETFVNKILIIKVNRLKFIILTSIIIFLLERVFISIYNWLSIEHVIKMFVFICLSVLG